MVGLTASQSRAMNRSRQKAKSQSCPRTATRRKTAKSRNRREVAASPALSFSKAVFNADTARHEAGQAIAKVLQEARAIGDERIASGRATPCYGRHNQRRFCLR